jgi:flagella basal body P-ring formation protein FlgA
MPRPTLFDSVWLLGSLAALAVPTAQGQSTAVPPLLEDRVLDRVAEVWDVAPESLQPQWGRIELDTPLREDIHFRLIGNGADGWFVVSFARGDGSTIAARVRVGIEDTVLVAARPLESGSELTHSDILREVRVTWPRPRRLKTAKPDVGWVVRRPIASGQELTFPAVSQPYVVSAGEPVQFTWSRGAVQITMTGIALNAARLGERVRARISGRSSTHVNGIATGPGTAKFKGGGE